MALGKIIRHAIGITASANNGFMVSIGCATLVYSNTKDLLTGLGKYLSDPEKWEKEYNKLGGGEQPVCTQEYPEPPTLTLTGSGQSR